MSLWVKSPAHLNVTVQAGGCLLLWLVTGFLAVKFRTRCDRLSCGTQKLSEPSARVIFSYHDLTLCFSHCPKLLPNLLQGAVG